jgi:hypothetical protein
MDRQSLEARIQVELGALRARFAQVTASRSRIEEWQEGGAKHYSLQLELRSPQRQLLVSGEARDNPLDALRAALDAAGRQLQEETTGKRVEP